MRKLILMALSLSFSASAQAGTLDCKRVREINQLLSQVTYEQLRSSRPEYQRIFAFYSDLGEAALRSESAAQTVIQGVHECLVGLAKDPSTHRLIRRPELGKTEYNLRYSPNGPDQKDKEEEFTVSATLSIPAAFYLAMIPAEKAIHGLLKARYASAVVQLGAAAPAATAAAPMSLTAGYGGPHLSAAILGWSIGKLILRIDDAYLDGSIQNAIREQPLTSIEPNFGFLSTSLINATPWKEYNSIQGVVNALYGVPTLAERRRQDADAAAVTQLNELRRELKRIQSAKSTD